MVAKKLNWYPAAVTAIVAGIGTLVLVGWMFDLSMLKSLRPDWATMKANTAVGFVLAAFSLLLLSSGVKEPQIFREIGYGLAAVVALLGGLTLLSHAAGWDLHIDQLLFRDMANSFGAMHPGRMSPNTALSFLLLGGALLLLDVEVRQRVQPAELLALAMGLISFLALMGYVYGVRELQAIGLYSSMELPSALTFLLLSTGVLYARPTRGLMAVLTDPMAGGIMTRQLLPAAILIPPLLGWLRMLGQQAGWYDYEFGLALLVSSMVVVLTILTWRNGALLNRVDKARLQGIEAVRQSQEQLESLVEQAPVSIAMLDREMRYIVTSGRWASEFNRGCGDLIGRHHYDVHPDLPSEWKETHRRGLIGEFLKSDEDRWVRSDGSTQWLRWAVLPWRDSAGSIGGIIISAEDITPRKRAEEKAQESQQRFQSLAEALPHLVWTCRPDGWCDYLSRQWVDYTGRPAEEQLGYGWAEQLHPEDQARVQAEWARATVRGDFFDVEFRIRRADGVYRWFKTRAVPLRDLSGNIVKWFGSNTDFDDYKRAEQRLRDQAGRHDLLNRITRAIGERQDLKSIFQVVIRRLEEDLPVDFGCVCLYERVSGTLTVTSVGTRSEPLALELAMTEQSSIGIDPNGLSRCVRGQLVYEPDISGVTLPFPQRLAEGGLRSLVAAPLLVESQVFGVLIAARRDPNSFTSPDCEFLRQLSEHVALASQQAQLHAALQQAYDDLRQTQQAVMQQERLRALGQMASGIAHDINNAVTPASLYTQSLLEKEPNLSPKARDYLETIQRALDDVQHTVSRMREFYRQRETELTLVPVNVNELVKQVADLTRARWSDMPQLRGIVIAFVMELTADLPEIMGVESEIREALTNLVFNAVDAMPDGGTLTLRTRAMSESEDSPDSSSSRRISVEVQDTGVGMDAMTQSRCFEPFFTTKGERGTGLGLAMVYGVIERHNADIQIESVLGRGTTVRLNFAASTTVSVGSEEPAKGRIQASMRILIVDDDPVLLKALSDTLESDGHIVLAANSGKEGIDAFLAAQAGDEKFAIVITDLGMPHIDGRKVASAVKSASPSTPVILLTGWGQRLTAEADIPPQVDCVLSKPPKLRDLRRAFDLASSAPEYLSDRDA